jgi:hypothetical protein
MNKHVVGSVILVIACVGLTATAQEGRKGRDRRDRKQPTQNSSCLDVPAHTLDLVLGRPERNSVTISVLVYKDTEGYIAYGTKRGDYTKQTPQRTFKKDEPAEVVIGSLQPNTRYFYQFHGNGIQAAEGSFYTQRPAGSPFTFTITADSHLDDHVSADLYQRTLANALADSPDFHIDLGDTFMTDKHESRQSAARQYLAQRFYFGQLCRSAPLFLVLGNHDGEIPHGHGADPGSLAVWSNTMRKRYFPNPVPDHFYSGNAWKHPQAGLLQDYYAWQWGDALFVVLDPFWFTHKRRGSGDNWDWTLGNEQYQWLKRTLEGSKASFKFVFIHHLVGGADSQCRGGVETAPFFEWGGKNADGTEGFSRNRPAWPTPIHQLLVENRVAIVFHGHDHFYAKQDVDGIVYQEVPQPGDRHGNVRAAAEYRYRSGVILAGSGHLRVHVEPNGANVEYVRACLPMDEGPDYHNGAILHSYSSVPRK